MSLRVAICIATHNRREELARTLAAIATLSPAPDELCIAADGCTDGTVAWLESSAPGARVIVHEQARGSIPSRNELASACRSEIFLSLDDDSYPMETDFLAHVRELFTTNPRLAVAAFPQRTEEDPASLQAEEFGASHFIGSFANSGAAIRKAAFIELGGYPDFFFHAYEEPDFALRCVAAGWQVRRETTRTIRHHFTSMERNELRTHQRHARNELWSVLIRCPAPALFGVVAFRVARQFGYAWRRGINWALREPAWWVAFFRGIPQCLALRKPLPWPSYLAWMRLQRAPIHEDAEWLRKFGTPGA